MAFLRLVAALLALAHMALIIWPAPETQETLLMATIVLFIVHSAMAGDRWLNPYFLFSLTATMFLAGRFIGANMVDYLDFRRGDWFIYGPIGTETMTIALGGIGLFFSGVMLTLRKTGPLEVRSDDGLYRYGLVAAIALLPFFLYRALENYRIYQSGSYLDLYLGGAPGGPLYTLGGWFIIAVFAVLASRPDRVRTIGFFLLGVVFCIAESIKGTRGIPLAHLIMLCWLLVTVLRIRVPFVSFAVSLVALLLFADYVGQARFGQVADFDLSTLGRSIISFYYSQGTTFLFVVGVAENIEKFSLVDALSSSFALFVDMVRGLFPWSDPGAMSLFGVETASLAERVASLTNPKMYNDGMGIGGSAVGEAMLYSIYWGPWAAGVFTGAVMRGLHRFIRRGPGGLFLFAYIFSFMLLVPRETQLYFVVPAIKALLFLFAFLLLKKTDESLRANRLAKRHGDRAHLPPGASA